jgi:hypothetical protein
MPDIEELYRKADWPEGEFQYRSSDNILLPGGQPLHRNMGPIESMFRAEFIVEACNYFLKHCRGTVEREAKAQAKREQRASMADRRRNAENLCDECKGSGKGWPDGQTCVMCLGTGLADRGPKP